MLQRGSPQIGFVVIATLSLCFADAWTRRESLASSPRVAWSSGVRLGAKQTAQANRPRWWGEAHTGADGTGAAVGTTPIVLMSLARVSASALVVRHINPNPATGCNTASHVHRDACSGVNLATDFITTMAGCSHAR